MTDDPLPLEYSGPVRLGRTGRRRRRPRGPAMTVADAGLSLTYWTWAAVAFLFVGAGWVLWLFNVAVGLYAVVLVGLSVPMLATAARAVRRRRADLVLGYVDQAVRLNHPLGPVLAAAARGERGRVVGQLNDVQAMLEGGLSITDALADAVPELTPRALGVLAHAEAGGRLPAAIDRLLRDDLRQSRQDVEGRAFAAVYPPLLVAIAGGVVLLVDVFVIPKYVQILHSFRVPLPRLTRWVIGLGDWLPTVAALSAVGVLVWMGVRLREAARGPRPPTGLLRDPWHRLLWHVPVWGTMHRDASLADLCHALADSVEQGLPLAAALDRAAVLDLSAVLRRRASGWAGGIANGQGAADAARAAGLPPLVAGLVATAAADGATLAAGLRFAGRFYGSRHRARRDLIAAAVVPAFTLAMGVLVAAVALGLFLPVRDMIDRLSPYPVGR